MAGTDIPHVFRAGIFYQEGNFVFWDVSNPEKTIVINLEDDHFAKLIVEVSNPNAAVGLLEDAVSQRRAQQRHAHDRE